MTEPRASYRLQLRGRVGLREAADLADYLERLGVSHLYLSPVFRARAGSTHGYDVVDPCEVDRSLGGERAFERLAKTARRHGLGLLLDVVPNHVAVSDENPYLDEVLAHGRASPLAAWFDVDWTAGRGRIRLPVLGRPLAEALNSGDLELRWTPRGLRAVGFDGSWPLDPSTLPPLLAEARRALGGAARGERAQLEAIEDALRALPPRDAVAPEARARRLREAAAATDALLAAAATSPRLRRALETGARRFGAGARGRRRLARLLGAQVHRLEFWRSARRHLNYRRFFEVDELIALRQEDAGVFAATHRGLLELVARGLVDGVRIDHVDGLREPARYLAGLRTACRAALPAAQRDLWLLVEKILAPRETLPCDWETDGTTGYEFAARLDDCLLDAEGAAQIERFWRRDTRTEAGFDETARGAKRLALETLLRPDLARVARAGSALWPRGERPPGAPWRRAIAAFACELPVYRTYVADDGRFAAPDERRVRAALAGAGRRCPELRVPLRALRDLLLPRSRERARAPERVRWIRSLEQLCGPAAAKGIEDTAFYRHTALLSRCEVGGAPGARLRDAPSAFHRDCAERAARGARSLLAASTHDTKRSADARARLAVLSEMPERWTTIVAAWRRAHTDLTLPMRSGPAPDAAAEHAIYQAVLALWPLPAGGIPGASERRRLAARVQAAVLKGRREARQRTGWTDPDARYEAALSHFVAALFDPRAVPGGARFLPEMSALAAEVAPAGLWKALSRALIQLTAPGVPDLYQGDELWRFSLVDPDNRRPVDWRRRRRLLRDVEQGFGAPGARRRAWLQGVVAAPEDGRVKLHVIRRALLTRREHADLFARGAYLPLRVRGRHAGRLIAFARTRGARGALVVAPRLAPGEPGRPPLGRRAWGDTTVALPRALAARRWRSALTGDLLPDADAGAASSRLAAADLLAALPVGLWIDDLSRRRRPRRASGITGSPHRR